MGTSGDAGAHAPEISISAERAEQPKQAPSGAADGGSGTKSNTVPTISERAKRRLERDRARGYSINVKQVILAFAVEFVIIGLILASQYIYASEIPNATSLTVAKALLFPIALAMVELARVPLAIAVRTHHSWNIKFSALIGVMCAVTVTAVSLSNIGNLTFNPRLENAQEKHNRLTDAQGERQAYLDQISAQQAVVDQKIKDRDQLAETYQAQTSTYTAQQGQSCSTITVPSPTQDGTTTQKFTCSANPALKLLQTEVAATKVKLNDAEAAIKQEQRTLAIFDRKPFDDKVAAAEAEYRTAVYQSQLHSYTAMLFHKDAQEVTDGEIKTLEGYLIWIPSLAAALSSTLIAMTAVHRIRARKEEAEVKLPDEAASYLFGPLVTAIRKEASEAVQSALAKTNLGSDQSASGARSSPTQNAAASAAAT